MELSYWESKWRKGKTGFHMKDGYPGLEKYWDSINLDKNPTVFVPLCGKSKDLMWLADRCKRVVGVEISGLAVEQFFSENTLVSDKSSFANFTIYRSENIELWKGDFFKLPKHKLPRFDLVYDRAALIALPPKMRIDYVNKLFDLISENTKILLQQFEYRQQEMPGPPFSVTTDEIKHLFANRFSIQILEKKELNLNKFKKFQKRGLQSYFIEILSLLLPIGEQTSK